MTYQQKKKGSLLNLKHYYWDEPYLFRMGFDRIIRICVSDDEIENILYHCHDGPAGEQFGADKSAVKVLQCGFYWPTIFRDAYNYVKRCDGCQRMGNTSMRNEMPLNNILEFELFDVWGIDFIGPFPPSNRNTYILVEVEYVSNWVEAVALPNNEAKSVVRFLRKNFFFRFRAPRGHNR